MSQQNFMEAAMPQEAAATAQNNYTTAKSVIAPTSLFDLPRNYWYLGRKARVWVWGSVSNIVTTPGTITFQIMHGTTAVWSSGAVQLNATAHTTLPFNLIVELSCRSRGSGTAATLMGMGNLSGIMFTLTAGQTDAVNTPGLFPVPATAPAAGSGFDSTVANTVDFWVGFSIANAGNQVQIQEYTWEHLM